MEIVSQIWFFFSGKMRNDPSTGLKSVTEQCTVLNVQCTHAQAITVLALRGAFNPDSFLGLFLPSEREQLSTAASL